MAKSDKITQIALTDEDNRLDLNAAIERMVAHEVSSILLAEKRYNTKHDQQSNTGHSTP